MKNLIILVCFYIGHCFGQLDDPEPLVKEGDVTIGIIAPLHSRDPASGACGSPFIGTMEEVAAVEWALNTINAQSQKDYSIGLTAYDTCNDEDLAIRQTLALLQDNLSPLIGVILLGSSSVVSAVLPTLHAYSIPVLITQTPAAHDITPAKNIFTTAPHLAAHAQAVLAAVEGDKDHQDLHRVGVVSSCAHATEVLMEEAARSGLTLHAHLNLTDGSNFKQKITEFISSHLGYRGIVIALLKSDDLNMLLQELDPEYLKKARVHWIVSLLNGEPVPGELFTQQLITMMPGAVLVEPHAPLLAGLKQFLKENQNTSVIGPLLEPCDETGTDWSCRLRNEALQISGSRATAAVKAVSSLAAGFRLVQIEHCFVANDCLKGLRSNLNREMVRALLKLSYTTTGGADKIRYTADGRLITSFTISRVLPIGLHQVGEYREDTGMVWTHGTPGGGWSGHEDSKVQAMALAALQQDEDIDQQGIIKSVLTSHQNYIGRSWAFTVLSLASVGALGCIYVAVYVGLRMCDGTVSGSQCMGALLLAGILGTYASCVTFVLPPTALTCRLRAWAPAICLALCYALLLVKSMHLRALVAMGASGEVSNVALYMSLLFMVGGQVILSLMAHDMNYLTLGDTVSPIVLVGDDGSRLCLPDTFANLASQCYLIILLIIGTGLALFNRNVRRNYNEGRWLLLTSCVSTPIVCAWTGMSYLAPPSLLALTTSAALLILATCLLLLIYIPKIRVISRQAREFKHKKLGFTSSISTVFNGVDMKAAIKPPPAFCDPHQLPPGAVLLPPNPTSHKVVCGNTRKNICDVSSSCGSWRSSVLNDQTLTPREKEINARYPIYEIDLTGAYP